MVSSHALQGILSELYYCGPCCFQLLRHHIWTSPRARVANLADKAETLRSQRLTVFLPCYSQAGFDEDMRYCNMRLAVGAVVILLALYAHIAPGKFPDNWWTVFGCVVGYMLCSALLSAYSHFAGRDVIFLSKPYPGTTLRLKATVLMERYSEVYRLALACQPEQPGCEVVLEQSVGVYFHEDGYFAEGVFQTAVERLVGQFDSLPGVEIATAAASTGGWKAKKTL